MHSGYIFSSQEYIFSLHQPSPSTASIPLHLLLSLHPVFISLKAQGLNTDGLGKKWWTGLPFGTQKWQLKKKTTCSWCSIICPGKSGDDKKCQVMWVRVDYRRAFRKIFSGKTHAKSDPEEWSPWRYIWNSQWLGQNWTSGTPVRPISIHSLEAKSTRN